MNHWAFLPLSLAGRINPIQLLTNYSKHPYPNEKSFFLNTQDAVSFIWGNKASQISKTHLQRPKRSGGLALPNFLFYHWACNI